MKNRSKYGVIAAILRSAMREETRTKIMYKAMLSNDQCRNYIDSLLNFGLIMEHNNGSKMVYKVTNKRATFIDYSESKQLCLLEKLYNISFKNKNIISFDKEVSLSIVINPPCGKLPI